VLGPIRVADLPASGTAFQGGYYAGLISHTTNGVPTQALRSGIALGQVDVVLQSQGLFDSPPPLIQPSS